jgi:hypothetical protein
MWLDGSDAAYSAPNALAGSRSVSSAVVDRHAHAFTDILGLRRRLLDARAIPDRHTIAQPD